MYKKIAFILFFQVQLLYSSAQKTVAEFTVLPYSVIDPVVKLSSLTNDYSVNSWGITPSYSFGITRNIYSWIYLKTAFSFTRFKTALDFDYKESNGAINRYSDLYSASVLSLQLLPEVRANYKALYAFANIGGGIYSVGSGVFEASRTGPGNFNVSDLNLHSIVLSSNGGVGFSIKDMGLFAGYGFSFYKPNNKNNPGLRIGYSVINLQAGVSYHID